LGLSLGTQGIVQREEKEKKKNPQQKTKQKEKTERGTAHESIHRKQTKQPVHLCYSWSKRDDRSCHRPAMKSLPS